MGSGAKQPNRACRRSEYHSRMGLQPDERLKKWFHPQNLGINLSIRFFSLSQQRADAGVVKGWDFDLTLTHRWVGVKRQEKMTLRLPLAGSPNVSHQQQLVFLKTISNQDEQLILLGWNHLPPKRQKIWKLDGVISTGNLYIVRLEGNEKYLGIITMLQADEAW